MEAAEIIEYLRDRDLTITLTDGDSLELSPAEKITNDLIERLRKHKPAIIAVLKLEQREQNQKIEMIRAWLYRIGEPIEDHDIVLNKCRNAPGAMTYFLKHANGVGAGRFFGCFELSTAPSPNFHTHKKGIS